jgi:(p)ppGpp synthase/HD superfamily hydrolase
VLRFGENADVTTALTLSDVESLARRAHSGQVDKQGRDYYEHHLAPIAASLLPFGESAAMAGLLHDVVEDTDWTIERLRVAKVPEPVLRAVDAVTRRPGESYDELIDRAAADPLGRLVKLADNWRNLTGLDDLARTDPRAAARLRPRYEAARQRLAAAVDAGPHC